MAENYATADEIKNALTIVGLTYADQDLGFALTAASRGIDNLCGRRFYADADANQVRYYTPDDSACLRVDDLVTLTELASDAAGDGTFGDTWTENTDFVLEPLNAAADGRPWTEIHRHPSGAYRFPCYPRSVRVTGKFGWAAVPGEVKEATMVLAIKLMRRVRDAPFGVVNLGLEQGGAVRIARTDPDVMFLVGPFIRNRIAAA